MNESSKMEFFMVFSGKDPCYFMIFGKFDDSLVRLKYWFLTFLDDGFQKTKNARSGVFYTISCMFSTTLELTTVTNSESPTPDQGESRSDPSGYWCSHQKSWCTSWGRRSNVSRSCSTIPHSLPYVYGIRNHLPR